MPVIIRTNNLTVEVRIKEDGHNTWHCHIVVKGYCNLVLSLDDDPIILAYSGRINQKLIRVSTSLVKNHLDILREKWEEYHG